jgi:tetratricopeptide (TPR) repeat protein
LQTQLDELQLAREFFADSGGDLQQVGRALVECDGRIKSIESALGRIPPDTSSELPQLAGIAVFDEAIARRPKNAALYVERAKYLIGKRHYERSIADCNQALQLLPNYYAAFNIRGFAHHHLGKCSAAVRNFERAIYEDPSYAWAYASLAATYNAAGAYREALGPAYYASITIAAGHNQLAIAYEHLSEHEKAVHHLTRVIEADPDAKRVPNARVRRAQQLIKLGRNQLAMHDLRTHLARKSDAAASQLLAQLKSLSACNGNATDAEGVDEDPHAEVVEQQLGIVEG